MAEPPAGRVSSTGGHYPSLSPFCFTYKVNQHQLARNDLAM